MLGYKSSIQTVFRFITVLLLLLLPYYTDVSKVKYLYMIPQNPLGRGPLIQKFPLPPTPTNNLHLKMALARLYQVTGLPLSYLPGNIYTVTHIYHGSYLPTSHLPQIKYTMKKMTN